MNEQETAPESLTDDQPGWLFLAYKVPSEPSSNRITIWRELKRLGAYYPQQAVCLLPDRPDIHRQVAQIRLRIEDMGGTETYLEIPHLSEDHHNSLVGVFTDLASREYAEIVEECDTKFVKEIEFEHFRENYTFEEAEEIRQDLDKIERWFAAVVARDWFAATTRGDAERRIKECAVLLEDFEATVYSRTGGSDGPV